MSKQIILIYLLLLVTACAGPMGAQGNSGADGSAGLRGPEGPEGTPIKLCSKVAEPSPSNFPEYGLCINDALYGVYWDRSNSWLTLISPGTYTSTQTGSNCVITVAAHCQVTQQ